MPSSGQDLYALLSIVEREVLLVYNGIVLGRLDEGTIGLKPVFDDVTGLEVPIELKTHVLVVGNLFRDGDGLVDIDFPTVGIFNSDEVVGLVLGVSR